MYERALQIYEAVYGLDHSDVANTLNNLANLLRTMGDYAEAKPMYERALQIYETRLGVDHPSTTMTRRNLELCLAKLHGD